MTEYSERIVRIKPSIIRNLDELLRTRPDAVNLSIGQNYLAEIPPVINEAIANMKKPWLYNPTAGPRDVLEHVADHMNEQYKAGLAAEDIILTDGGFGGLRTSIQVLLSKNSHFIVDSPTFAYPVEAARLLNDFPYTNVHWLHGLHDKLKPDVDDLQRIVEYIRAQNCKGNIVYYTQLMFNPQAKGRTEAEVRKLVEYAESEGIILILDNVYRDLWRNEPRPFLASTFSDTGKGIIDIEALSKNLGTMGIRVGAMISKDKEFMKYAKKAYQFTAVCPNSTAVTIWDTLATKYSEVKPYIEITRKRIMENIDAVSNILRGVPGIKFEEPDGAIYHFFNFEDIIDSHFSNSIELSEALIKEVGVGLVPGVAFTEPHDPIGLTYLRLNAAHKDAVEGAKRLRTFLENLK